MAEKNQIVKSNRGRYEYRLTPQLIEVTKEGGRRASQRFYTPRALFRIALNNAGIVAPGASELDVFRSNGNTHSFNVRVREGRVQIGCRYFSKAESKRIARWAGATL